MSKSPLGGARTFDRRHWVGKLWPRWSWTAEKLNWNARYRGWLEEHRPRLFDDRMEMFEELCPAYYPIKYLEFGVFEGESLARWVALNSHPSSEFHGFDSFEGLADEEGSPWLEGQFDVVEMPKFTDDRVHLHKGWFTETLPSSFGFLFAQPATRFVHIDCDHYGPTLYVLTMLNPVLTPGTIVMFDETSVAQCEFRALLDWATAYGRSYTVLAGWKSGRRVEGVAIRITG
jgi:hypothetical protein